MTIETQGKHAIWLRCGSAQGDVLLIQIDADTGNLLIDAYHPESDNAECSLVIPPMEALLVGYVLIDMAQRQMAAPPKKVYHDPDTPPTQGIDYPDPLRGRERSPNSQGF
jgi:hypothetical protein